MPVHLDDLQLASLSVAGIDEHVPGLRNEGAGHLKQQGSIGRQPSIANGPRRSGIPSPAVWQRGCVEPFDDNSIGNADLENLEMVWPILKVNFNVGKRFQQAGRRILAAIDYRVPLRVPSSPNQKPPGAIKRGMFADAPENQAAYPYSSCSNSSSTILAPASV